MTQLVAIGLETGLGKEFDNFTGSIETASKRSGAYSARINAMTFAQKYFPARNELFIQFGVMFIDNRQNYTFFRLNKGNTTLLSLWCNASAKMELYRGDKTTLLATSNKVIVTNVWYLFECHVIIHDSTGLFDLRIDTFQDLVFNGDTKPGADGDIDNIYFYGYGNAPGMTPQIDDIIINDANGSVNNSWVNGARVAMLSPAGAGSLTQWTPSAGANYQCVDELPMSVADYNNVNADAQTDLFTLSNLPADATTILSIMPIVAGLKVGVPAVNNIKTAYQVSGYSPRLSGNHALGASLAVFGDIVEINPETTNPFTVAEVNALEGGYKSAT